MKFTIPAKAFNAAIKAAGAAIERRNTIPVLSSFHVEAGKGRIKLRGTNLDMEIVMSAAADVKGDGAICVDAERLGAIVGKFSADAEVLFELDDKDQVTLRSGRSRFKLNTLPPADFPDLKRYDSNHRFTLPVGALQKLLKADFAMSDEETRYYLNGIYLHVATKNGSKDQVLRGVATDGHRLAMIDVALPEGADKIPAVIVPRDTIGAIEKIMRALSPDSITLTVAQNGIEFAAGDVTLRSKVVDGQFPDYMRVVPLGNDKVLRVDTEKLIGAADRVSTVASERGRAVRFDIEPDSIKLSVANPDTGNAEEEIGAEYADAGHGPMTIGFNSRYLQEILAKIDSEDLHIKLADPGSPTLFVTPNDASMLCVLMPMRV